MTRETQKTIAVWANETFGPSTAKRIATRMNVEVAELLICLEELGNPNLPPEERERLEEKARFECADVEIVLVQVIEKLRADMLDYRDRKMTINRERKWERLENGKMQHVEKTAPRSPEAKHREKGVWEFHWEGKLVDPLDATPKQGHEMVRTFQRMGNYAAAEEFMRQSMLRPKTFKEQGSGLEMSLDRYYIVSDSGSAYSPLGFATVPEALRYAHSLEFVNLHGPEIVPDVPCFDPELKSWVGSGIDACSIVYGADMWVFWRAVEKDFVGVDMSASEAKLQEKLNDSRDRRG